MRVRSGASTAAQIAVAAAAAIGDARPAASPTRNEVSVKTASSATVITPYAAAVLITLSTS